MLIGASELIEQRSLAAVLVAHEGESQDTVLWKRVLMFLDMVFAAFAETGMNHWKRTGLVSGTLVRSLVGIGGGDFDQGGLRLAQRKAVSVYQQFHGVPERSILHKLHLLSGNHSHVEEMLAQRALPSHADYSGISADFQLVQCHSPRNCTFPSKLGILYMRYFEENDI